MLMRLVNAGFGCIFSDHTRLLAHQKRHRGTKSGNTRRPSAHTTSVSPIILKQPNSAFSQGVIKVEDEHRYKGEVERLLEKSDLIIAQQFLPTPFDWRVGIFDRRLLFVCRYFMAHKHWQIIRRDSKGRGRSGNAEAVALEDVPPQVIQTALRVANLIGNGLYGVDLKQIGEKCYVIEVNDNPNIEAGTEDGILKNELYTAIMSIFLKRIEESKSGRRSMD